jgi:hypothetical protein
MCILTSDKATVDQVYRMNRETLERFVTKINPATMHVGKPQPSSSHSCARLFGQL